MFSRAAADRVCAPGCLRMPLLASSSCTVASLRLLPPRIANKHHSALAALSRHQRHRASATVSLADGFRAHSSNMFAWTGPKAVSSGSRAAPRRASRSRIIVVKDSFGASGYRMA